MPACLRLVVADRSGALALGSPWHLARLGTWHALALGTCVVATVLPWSLPACLVFSLCVLATRARSACPAFRVCRLAWRLGTWAALALGTPWHLPRDRRDRALVESFCASVLSLCVLAARVRCLPCVSDAWDGMGWYGMVWYGMVWYGMVWDDGMGWDGMGWDAVLLILAQASMGGCTPFLGCLHGLVCLYQTKLNNVK